MKKKQQVENRIIETMWVQGTQSLNHNMAQPINNNCTQMPRV